MTTPDLRSPTLHLATTLVLLVVAVATSGVWFVRSLDDVPMPIVLSAAAPALAWSWLITRIDRRHPEPWWTLGAALLAGAVIAASASHVVNGWLLEWANAVTGDRGRPLVGGFGGPVVEELAKAAALAYVMIAVRQLVDGTLDGIVYGALVGMGFAFTENVIYLTFAVLMGGSEGLVRAVYVRALLGGCNHAAFTATTGAAFGWAAKAGARPGRWLVPAIGLALAIVQHVVWNAVAANAITGVLCGPELAGGPCRPVPTDTSLFVLVPILTAIFLGPGLVTLGAITVLARRRSISAAVPGP
jgi:RsiW-degrading membrane proteinase PrsW (M82 family)